MYHLLLWDTSRVDFDWLIYGVKKRNRGLEISISFLHERKQVNTSHSLIANLTKIVFPFLAAEGKMLPLDVAD
jgi:hypothetical protein